MSDVYDSDVAVDEEEDAASNDIMEAMFGNVKKKSPGM
jgi:hypothetical protein